MELFFLWIICAIVAAVIASSKGRSAFGWFLLGCLISIFAVILVAVLPSQKPAAVLAGAEVASPATHVRCPDCKELVLREALVCKHCHAKLIPQPPPGPDNTKTTATAIAILVGIVVIGGFAAYNEHRTSPAGPMKTWSASSAAPAQTPADYNALMEKKRLERQAAFDVDEKQIMTELRRLMAARKYEEAAKYANDYYDVGNNELRDLHTDADRRVSDAVAAKAKAYARTKGVSVGMTKDQVLASSWGRPTSVNSTTTARGTHEQWVYGGRNYLYFDNDTLTSIQN